MIVVDATGSTNDDLRTLAAEGAPEGTVLVAGHQTRGRGRLGRVWHSPRGTGLYASVLLRPTEDIDRIGRYGLAAAVAACAAGRAAAGDAVTIKWPNDLVAGGRKLAGILAEMRMGADGAELVIGFGINVSQRPQDFPEEIRDRSTSLLLLGGPGAAEREALAIDLLARFANEVALLRSGAWARVAERFLRYAPRAQGATVRLAAGGHGVTRGLDSAGALQVETADGIVAVHASESVTALED